MGPSRPLQARCPPPQQTPQGARTHGLASSPPPALQHLGPGMPWEAEAGPCRRAVAATGLKGKCFLNEIKRGLFSRAFGGALKTQPKATEIKVTFVQRGALGGVGLWGCEGAGPPVLPHQSSQERRGRVLPVAPSLSFRPLCNGRNQSSCARSRAPSSFSSSSSLTAWEEDTVPSRVYRWGNRGPQRGGPRPAVTPRDRGGAGPRQPCPADPSPLP